MCLIRIRKELLYFSEILIGVPRQHISQDYISYVFFKNGLTFRFSVHYSTLKFFWKKYSVALHLIEMDPAK
jgi:hypothetical protein